MNSMNKRNFLFLYRLLLYLCGRNGLMKHIAVNYIDLIILLFLTWGAFRGFSKGLIVEIATLVSLVLGVYFAIEYSPCVEGFLRDYLNLSSKHMAYIALAVTFVLVVLIVYIIGKLLTKLINLISLGLLNRCLGIVLGVAKYSVIVCVLLLIVDIFNEKFQFISEEAQQESLLFQPFLKFAQQMYNVIRF